LDQTLQNYQKSKIFDAAKTKFLQASFCGHETMFHAAFFKGLTFKHPALST